MIVGVDFDNTIVGYDQLFHRVAVEQGLVPTGMKPTKSAVREQLRNTGQEDAWTELQGYVYGARMAEAEPIPGALECLEQLIRHDVEMYIISHKTRHPYRGPQYDLHAGAWNWLEDHGAFESSQVGLRRSAVFFEETKEAKLARIAVQHCTHFIDDLPEILNAPDFPDAVERILFDPSEEYVAASLAWASAWSQIPAFLDLKFRVHLA